MNSFNDYYWEAKFRMLLTLVVLVGGLNWGATALGYNLVEMLSNAINQSLKTNYPIDKTIYLVVALCAVLLAVRRTTWLPFLGKAVLPDTLVPLKTPENSDMKVKIKTKPNSKVAYWASLPRGKKPDVIKAYDDYSNSGVVMTNDKGEAELPLLAGTEYTVPSGRTIPRHVHYRVLGKTYAMMGDIETVYY